jgi:hypothetical protein
VLGDSQLLSLLALLWNPLLGPSDLLLLLLLLLLVLVVLAAALFEAPHKVVSKCRWLVIQLSSSAMEVSLQCRPRWRCNGQEFGCCYGFQASSMCQAGLFCTRGHFVIRMELVTVHVR